MDVDARATATIAIVATPTIATAIPATATANTTAKPATESASRGDRDQRLRARARRPRPATESASPGDRDQRLRARAPGDRDQRLRAADSGQWGQESPASRSRCPRSSRLSPGEPRWPFCLQVNARKTRLKDRPLLVQAPANARLLRVAIAPGRGDLDEKPVIRQRRPVIRQQGPVIRQHRSNPPTVFDAARGCCASWQRSRDATRTPLRLSRTQAGRKTAGLQPTRSTAAELTTAAGHSTARMLPPRMVRSRRLRARPSRRARQPGLGGGGGVSANRGESVACALAMGSAVIRSWLAGRHIGQLRDLPPSLERADWEELGGSAHRQRLSNTPALSADPPSRSTRRQPVVAWSDDAQIYLRAGTERRGSSSVAQARAKA